MTAADVTPVEEMTVEELRASVRSLRDELDHDCNVRAAVGNRGEVEWRCGECKQTILGYRGHGDECMIGAELREAERSARMYSTLKALYAVAEHGLYGNTIGVRNTAFDLVESHVVGREGSWEADLVERAEAAGNWALVGYGELEALRKALSAE